MGPDGAVLLAGEDVNLPIEGEITSPAWALFVGVERCSLGSFCYSAGMFTHANAGFTAWAPSTHGSNRRFKLWKDIRLCAKAMTWRLGLVLSAGALDQAATVVPENIGRDTQAGQPADIASSAYHYRADRVAG